MVEVWAHNCFNLLVMIEWNKQSTNEKIYVDVVISFTKQLRANEHFDFAD
jgi:hypothetical protein